MAKATQTVGALKLSELIKIGVRYFKPDRTNFWLFNDGTMMWSRNDSFTNDSGTSFDDEFFLCMRDGTKYNIIDDIYDTLPPDVLSKLGRSLGYDCNSNWQLGE